MPRVTMLSVQTLYDLPPPPGASPIATPIATPVASPTASPFATPLAEMTATPATPTVVPQVTSADDSPDTRMIILVVVVVLGAVVLIAWLLKPLVVRRLAEEESADAGEEAEPGEPPITTWTRGPAPRDTAATPNAIEPVPESDASSGEIDTPDVAGPMTEDRSGAEYAFDAAAPVEPAVEVAEPAEEAPAASVEGWDEIVQAEEIVGITLTVRGLLEFANTGQLLRGFDLYSESYLQRFRAETGLTDAQFVDEYGSIPAPPPEARIELAAVTDVEVLADGRVSALISFRNGDAPPRPERFVFVRVSGRWLIDDIAGVD